MEGFAADPARRGVIARAVQQVFDTISGDLADNVNKHTLVRVSYLQIYKEVISDLLRPELGNLAIREDKKKGIFVEGLSEWVVRSVDEVADLLNRGSRLRATASTKMNDVSSRSHAVLILMVEQSEIYYQTADGTEVDTGECTDAELAELECKKKVKLGKLNLVDLAGSERVRVSGASGDRLEEVKHINQSLSALGNVIAALTDTNVSHIPYRNSKLTRLLEDSLGGNCKTTLVATIGPAEEAATEAISTLKFASRAKHVRNFATQNVEVDQKAMIRKYETEIRLLQEALLSQAQGMPSEADLAALDEERKKAELDRIEAQNVLEERSREYNSEREQKGLLRKQLERLEEEMSLMSNMGQESPSRRNETQMSHEYQVKMSQIKKDRAAIVEDKAQVDKYKHLLLKQRDVMIALTASLNRRDETITALQEEVDAFDQHQQTMEETIDLKISTAMQLKQQLVDLKAFPRGQHVKGMDLSDQAIEARTALSDVASMINPQSSSKPNNAQATKSKAATQQRVQVLQSKLEVTLKEKSELERTLRDRLEQMVNTELEERISKVCRAQRDNGTVGSKEALQELSKMRSDTPEFQQQLALIVAANSKQGGDHGDTVEDLKSALSQKGGIMKLVFSNPSKQAHQQLLLQVAEAERQACGDGVQAKQLEQHRAELVRQHNERKAKLVAQLQEKEAALKSALMESRRLMGAGSHHTMPLRSLQQNISMIEKETQMVSSSYQKKVLSLKSQIAMEEKQAKAEHRAQAEQLVKFRQQTENDAKERKAIKTILDVKIMALVENVERMCSKTSSMCPSVSHDISTLKNLVKASVDALE
eukprot:TRINITY_DN18595_c0_g1_i1.p1 TRINITY_DN18595_c0_g1~~TRINITY_DN18595_c0_g1_i1.p1  ORF type:complete len:824 (-),score=312.43 TRINITY_DN18595_c0_g1_i1:452-2923(-)